VRTRGESQEEGRQIVLIGFSEEWHPYRRTITNIYQLSKSDRYDYYFWKSLIREQNERTMVTSTDRLRETLADGRLRWSNPGLAGEGHD
jgi:hypothetical protein